MLALALVCVPFKHNHKVSNWLPEFENANLLKNSSSCFTNNARVYLDLLPWSSDGEPIDTKEKGIYYDGLFQPSDEYWNAATTTTLPSAQSIAGDTNAFTNNLTSGINATGEMSTITQNTTDANISIASPLVPVQLPDLYSSNTADVGEDINKFLSRPRVYLQGKFQSGDTVSTFTPIKLFYDLLNNTGYMNKISGFIGFKATTVFTLQVNATKFQQGRYMLAFVPSGGADDSNSSFYKMHTFTLKQRTQLPHVELDLSCDTQAILKIPFVSAETYYPLKSASDPTTGGIGKAVIFPYEPLSAGSGSNEAYFTLYVHFEDIHLHGPTIPQSGWIPEKEARAKNVGPVSSVLLQSSQAAGILSRVPMISSYAQSAQWMLNISAGVARAFGLSKPKNLDKHQYVQTVINSYMNNADGVTNLIPLSVSTDSALVALPGFAGNDIDELSIDYLKGIFSWNDTRTWTVGTAAGTVLNTYSLYPNMDMYATQDTGFLNVYNTGPMGALAQRFGNWRGSIKLRIKFVKTQFHSGRLLFLYTPVDVRANVTTTPYTNQEFLMKRIVDVRETNEVTMIFPYISNKNYLHTNESSGLMEIYILDPLSAPSTVTQSIRIIIEIAAGPDMEFFNPSKSGLTSYIPAVPQGDYDPGCAEMEAVIGGGNVKVTDAHAEACVGERILSLRQLAQFWGPIVSYATGFYPPTNPNGNCYKIWPFFVSAATNNGSASPTLYVQDDYYSFICNTFAINRGSVRVHMYTPSEFRMVTRREVMNYSDTIALPAASTNAWVRNGMLAEAVRDVGTQGFMTVECPAYGKTPSRASGSLLTNAALTNQVTTNPDYLVASYTWSGTADDWIVYRSVGDDFTAGYFVGIPPCVLIPTH